MGAQTTCITLYTLGKGTIMQNPLAGKFVVKTTDFLILLGHFVIIYAGLAAATLHAIEPSSLSNKAAIVTAFAIVFRSMWRTLVNLRDLKIYRV